MPRANADLPGATIAEAKISQDWTWPYLNLDAAPFRYIVERHSPLSVADIGCGKGVCLRMLKDFGVPEVLGIDQVPLAASLLTASDHVETDLNKPFDARRKFDLVMCLEVLEHLLPKATGALLDTIERHATGRIVFSMAEVGRPGHGHINCRSIDEVLVLWAERGWVPNLNDTLAMRALSTFSWFRRNLLVLEPAVGPGETAAARVLKQIGQLKYRWYDQKPGVRLAAFQEPFPMLDQAYGRLG